MILMYFMNIEGVFWFYKIVTHSYFCMCNISQPVKMNMNKVILTV